MNTRLAFSFRIVWALALLASLGVLGGALPGYFTSQAIAGPAAQIAPLALAGAWLEVCLSLSAAVVSLALACVLFWKKADDSMGLVLSFFLLLYGSVLAGPIEFFTPYWFPQRPELGLHLQTVVMPAPLLVVILIFPNGRFVPQWTRGLLALGVLTTLVGLALEFGGSVANTQYAQIIYAVPWWLCGFAIAIQAYRFRRLYTPNERQQTKWAVYGTALWAALIALTSIPYFYVLSQPSTGPEPWWLVLSDTTWWLSLNILPIAITLAILRSRLWDIDLIIRRTLVYSTLTLTLGSVYVGCIVVLRALIAPLTGSSDLAIVGSTLAIAALFFPLRRRIQRVIDRRFFRKKYNAAQVLAAFGATARDETDLARLTAALTQAVAETMQPESAGVWLREPTHAHSSRG